VMGKRRPKTQWYTAARLAQEAWKASTATLPHDARAAGTTWVEGRGQREEVGPLPICLPTEHAALNLLPGVRSEALSRFEAHGIQWHGWTPGPCAKCWPSTHLLDSQVQCVNTLLSLANEPGLLLEVVRRVVPAAADLDILEDDSPVAFEWIGVEDYLGEGRGRARHRGRFATSADALVVARRGDGGRTGIVVEWKFTESYDKPIPFRGDGGRDRRDIYRRLYEADSSPFAARPSLDAFFHDPHYQLFRQALLAAAMVRAAEFGIDETVLLHVIPANNKTLRTTVTVGLGDYGDQIADVWRRLLPGPSVRYACMASEPLLMATPELAERYGTLVRAMASGADPIPA
jgi:hypothetical protein